MFFEYKKLLTKTKFIYLWVSQLLSQITVNILNYILLIHIFTTTGSSLATSLLWITYALPVLFAGPIGAASVDFLSKRKVLMYSNFFQAITILILAIFYADRFYLIFASVFIYALFNQFYVPAEQSSVPFLVSKKQLPFANGLFFTTQQLALILGFGIAGFLNKFLGFKNSLYLASAMLFLAFVSVNFLPKLLPKEKIKGQWEDAILTFFKKIYDGYLFIKQNKKIMFPFLLLIALQIIVSVVIVNVPVLSKEILNISLNLAGLVIVVPVGIGALLGALLIPKLLKKGLRKRRLIENSLFGLSFFVFLLVFGVSLFSYIPKIILIFVTTILIGISFVGVMIPSQTYLQEITPGGMRGRVFGNYWFLVTLATILPVVLSATIVEVFGARILFLILTSLIFTGFIIARKAQNGG